MVGTSVANLPKDLSVPKLYLGGCPLYSPWTPPLQGPGQMPLEGDHDNEIRCLILQPFERGLSA